jgi:hypothetical protein
MQVWHSLQFCFIFRVGSFASVTTTSASDLSLRYSNLGTTLAPFYSETWTHSVLSFATYNLKYVYYISPILARNLGAQCPSFALHHFQIRTNRAYSFAHSSTNCNILYLTSASYTQHLNILQGLHGVTLLLHLTSLQIIMLQY